MNPLVRIEYKDDLPVLIQAASITNYPMQYHPDTIEIIYALKGEVDVRVSFEDFTLQTGDFIVVNHEDFHYIKGKDQDNAVISLYIDLRYLEKSIKHIRYITFACESFTIQDNRKEYVNLIRELIQKATVEIILKQGDYITSANDITLQIIKLLVDHFTILQFYVSDRKLKAPKLDKYYSIMKKLDDGYQNKALLEEISKSEFYSKYHLAHLYKGLMLMSIQDSLSATRCFKSEILLLTSDKSIQDISQECGFSDTKYYYKHFFKWYACTPAQYRKRYKPEISSECIFKNISSEELLKLIEQSSRDEANRIPDRESRESIEDGFNYSIVDLFSDLPEWNVIDAVLQQMKAENVKPYVVMNFEDKTAEEWTVLLEAFHKHYSEEFGSWRFCFYYRKTEQKEYVHDLISIIKKICPEISLTSMLVWAAQ